MIPYYGKHYAKQFTRGFKNCELCANDGYMVTFFKYTLEET